MTKAIKKTKKPASLLVTQANELVEARYNLTIGEQRLILTMIAHIQPDDQDFKPYDISLQELAEFLGIDKNHVYADCKKLTKTLLGRVVEIKEEGRLIQTHWVSSADYVDGTGVVSLSFDPLLKPYLLQLKSNFTSCKLAMLLSFRSQYTMRMYQLLRRYAYVKHQDISLIDLRNTLGLTADQHQLYGNLKKNILLPVQRELNQKSDLSFEFEEIKRGRRVESLRLTIINKTTAIVDQSKQADSTKTDVLFDELMALIPASHRTKRTVQATVTRYLIQEGYDYVGRNILYSNEKADKSYVGFLNNALKDDWGHDWVIEQPQQQNKKKTLEVWERAGFPTEKAYSQYMYQRHLTELSQARQRLN